MSAFRPISPHAALQIFEEADIGADKQRLMANLAMAGVVKGYARLVETEAPGASRTELRDARIDRSLWRRIVAEEKIAEVYGEGSVHLDAKDHHTQPTRISVIGIRFDAVSVRAAAADHGAASALCKAPALPVIKPQPAVAPVLAAESGALPAPSRLRPALAPESVQESIDDTAAILGVSRGTVYNLIKRGQLAVKKVGTRTLVLSDSIRALLA